MIYRVITWVAAIGIGLGAAYWQISPSVFSEPNFEPNFEPKEDETIQSPAPASAPGVDPGREIAALRAEIDVLRQQLANVQADAAATPVEPPPPADASESVAAAFENASNERHSNVAFNLEQRFAQDVTTGDDAIAESEISTAFTHQGVTGAHLTQNACRASICRIELDFDDVVTRDRVLGELDRLVPWSSEGYVHWDAENELNAVVFATRAGAQRAR